MASKEGMFGLRAPAECVRCACKTQDINVMIMPFAAKGGGMQIILEVRPCKATLYLVQKSLEENALRKAPDSFRSCA